MDIFDNKPKAFLRRVRTGLSSFFGMIGQGFSEMGDIFRSFPRSARVSIRMGGILYVAMLVFLLVVRPLLDTPEPEPDLPAQQREVVVSEIKQTYKEASGGVYPEEVPGFIEKIDEQQRWVEENIGEEDKKMMLDLQMSRARVYYNAKMFYEAGEVYKEILERGLIENDQYFDVYSKLYYSYKFLNDSSVASQYAALATEEYLKGYMRDDGGCITYAKAANMDINVCPSMND